MSEKPIEAEVVAETQALAIRPVSQLPTVQDLEQSFALAVRQRELLSEYIKKQLIPGKHYFQRGNQKPSLAKEGAEIILLPHGFVPDYEIVSGPEQAPEDDRPYQIVVKCTLRQKGNLNSFVGAGIGSAGSLKQKRDGKYVQRQSDRYLCHNATVKMAQKSAMIAATINSTAASEFFTQDIEPGQPVQDNSEDSVSAPKPSPRPAKPAIPMPTAKTRARMIERLGEEGLVAEAIEYFHKVGDPAQLLPNEPLGDLPLRFVPASQEEMNMLITRIKQFANGDRAEPAFQPHYEDAPVPPVAKSASDEAWRGFPMPFGKNAGVTLENLEKNYLFGLWANYTVETEYKGKPKKPETIAKDETFRAMLDMAGKHYEFRKTD